ILLENARKYSPAGSEVEVSVEAADEGAMVSVMDRGVGIAEEHRERVFERFYQVEEAQHHSKPGLGLGLFLAKRIVEEHGGRIWHEPRPGGGSIFRFVI
ncbi:MAG: sensor histidine kinase, partial [Candidatus Geothermincolales bacterium]